MPEENQSIEGSLEIPHAQQASTAEDEKLIPQSVLEKTIKERLKNHVARQEALESQVNELQQQLQQPASPDAQPAQPMSPEAAQMPAPVEGGQPPAPTIPQGEGQPVTQADLQTALQQQATTAQNNQYQQKLQGMMNDDSTFKDLAEKTDGLQIPHEVAQHLTLNLDKDTARKTMKHLLTSQLDNAKMTGTAYKGMATGDWGDYNKWLQSVLSQQSTPDNEKASPDMTPDLSPLDKGSSGDNDSAIESALTDFAQNPY